MSLVNDFIAKFELQMHQSPYQHKHRQWTRRWLLSYFRANDVDLSDPNIYAQTWKQCWMMYEKSVLCVGDNVGIIAAQSIGERQTQFTLNTFHHTGATNITVSTGVPRFNELLNATRTPTYIQYKCITQPLSLVAVRVFTKRLIARTLKDVIEVIDEKEHFDASWSPPPHLIALSRPCLYIRFKPMFMYETHFSLKKFAQQWILFQNIDYIIESPIEYGECYIWTNVPIHILVHYPVMGIDSVIDVAYRPEDESVKTEQERRWELCITTLYNKKQCILQRLFQCSFLSIHQLESNHMWDVWEYLGVEATRCFLLQEFQSIFGTMLHQAHICLLVDMMLYNGKIQPISRYGVQKNFIGPLARASFEETMDNFLEAGWTKEIDTLDGVSSAIVCGNVAPVGTNLVDILFS